MTAPADDWLVLEECFMRARAQKWSNVTANGTRIMRLPTLEHFEIDALGRIIAARDRGNPKQLLALGLTFVGSFALGIVCAGLIIGAICRL